MLKNFSCEFCGKEFQDYESNRKKNHVFCSPRCSARYRSRAGRIKKTCPQCEKEFDTLRSKPNTFCSKSCSNRSRWHKGVYHHLPNPPKEKIRKICDNCGKEFYVHPYRKDEARFCCYECFKLFVKRNGWPPHVVEKIRNATLRQYEKGLFPLRDTRLEKRMVTYLEELNIDFIKQKKVKNRLYDFFIPSKNILIECDGDYWHGNKSLYPIPNEMQKNHIKIDNEKNELALQKGYNLLRFWGSEIKKDPDGVKAVLKNACL